MPRIKKTQRAKVSGAADNVEIADKKSGRQARFDPAHPMPRRTDESSASSESSDNEIGNGRSGNEPRIESDLQAVIADRAADSTLSADETDKFEALAAEMSPHLRRPDSNLVDAMFGDSSEPLSVAIMQQFRTQAEQLAEHLKRRQRDMDHREAEFHAQLARHEAEARSARLWFQEHQLDLLERQAALAERQQELASQRSNTSTGPSAAEVSESANATDGARQFGTNAKPQLQALSEADIELLRQLAGQHELEEKLAQRLEKCEARERALDSRQDRLEKAEMSLARSQSELEDAWQKFSAQRDAWQVQADEERHKLADDRRRNQAEQMMERESLAKRSQHLQLRTAALEQTRGELMRQQRETLEMRLASEELWAQLAGAAPPATITQKLAQLRTQLADHFRLQSEELAQQRCNIESLTTKVAQQHERTATERRELQQWLVGQQREIESQAARLVAREQELEQEERTLRQSQIKWQFDRREMEREIRRLQAEIRSLEAAAAATAAA